MDKKIIKYFDKEKAHYVDYEYDYPSERELVTEIFKDEAKEIIKEKIKDGNDLSRLSRLQAMSENNPHFLDWENAVIKAKAVPIQDICELKKLKRKARGWECLCPLHDDKKTPSFVIYSDNHYRCFGCNSFGDSIDLYMKLHKVDMKTAVNSLNGGQK